MKTTLKNRPTIHSKEKVHRSYGIKKWMKNRLKSVLNNTGGVRGDRYKEVIEAFCEKEKYFDNPRLKNLSPWQRKELFVSKRFAKFCAFALKYEFKEEENTVETVLDKTELVSE